MASAKDYLRQIRIYKNRAIAKQREAMELRGNISFLRGIDYSGDKVQTSPADSMSTSIGRLVDLEREVTAAIELYSAEKDKRINQIHQLGNSLYEDILILRYVDEFGFEEICNIVHASYSTVTHAHGEALEAFRRKFLD